MAATTAAIVGTAATVASTAYAASQKPGAPKQPNFSKSYAKGVQAQIAWQPALIAKEMAMRQQYDSQMIDQSLANTEKSATALATQRLDLNDALGARQIAQDRSLLQLADPNALAIRDTMGANAASDLALGHSIGAADVNRTQQSVRNAQLARGRLDMGDSAAVEEALAMRDEGNRLYQQRLGNAMAYLSTPQPSQLAPHVAYTPGAEPGGFRYMDPSGGQSGVNFASQNYATSANVFATQASQPNPWVQGLGALGGIALNYATRPTAPQYGAGQPDPRDYMGAQRLGTI